MANARYPSVLTVGRGSTTQVLVAQEGQLLLVFRPQMADADIDAYLPTNLLGEAELAQEQLDTLRTSKLRWVTTDDDALALPARAASLMTIVDAASMQPALRFAMPLYQRYQGDASTAVAPLLDTFIVKLVDNPPQTTLDTLTGWLGAERTDALAQAQAPAGYRIYTAAMVWRQPTNSFEILAAVLNLPGVLSAEHDWVKLFPFQQPVHHTATKPKHKKKTTKATTFQFPPLAQQWNLDAIQLPSLGIAVSGSSVVVGVFDEWFDLDHPDLKPRYTAPETHFNATESANVTGVAPGNMHAGPGANDVGGHGTHMAGLIGASPKASGGATGIAAGCRIMPLRLGSVQDLTDPNAQFALSSGLGVAGGIRWAADHGARVLNMSFDWQSAVVISEALEYANAKDVVLCAAAGNVGVGSSPQVAYPACEPSVIAVGAVDKDLKRHLPTSDDGDNHLGEKWTSQYDIASPQTLSVVAPGIRCWTTDARNPRGENQSGGQESAPDAQYTNAGDPGGNYYALGRATSIATAHVSALAAHIIARQPTLSNADVRLIIERTCQPVSPGGAYVYDDTTWGKNSGDWNEEMGYGLIDVTAALNDPLLMP
jgi:hypothetical protein